MHFVLTPDILGARTR